MEEKKLDIFDIHSDEFRFLDYPNTFLSDDKYEDGDLNKSANTQLEEQLKELIKVTSERQQPTSNRPQLNGSTKNNYLDDLNDIKELKRIEDKKSYQQSLDRLSKLNVAPSANQANFASSNYSSSSNYTSTYPSNFTSSNYQSNHLNNNENRKMTYKFENKSLRAFKSNNHLPTNDQEPKIEPTSKFDSTFDVRNYSEENEKTFTLNNHNRQLFNLSGLAAEHPQSNLLDDDDVNNTFTIAKNYDEVQEIARKQEEALKKHNNNKTTFLPSTPPSINNATIIKAKKNGPYSNKLNQTITLKNLINENLNDSIIRSPNLDGTFNLGNPMESPSNGAVKKALPNSRSFILNQNIVNQKTNIKRVLNNKNGNLEPKNNRLNSSFIVGDVNDVVKLTTATDKEDFRTINLPNVNLPSSQFSTITKNKITANLKRTNTFKVREFQYASEENLTSNLTFSKNGLNPNFIAKSGLSVNNYTSIDDMKNYETIKLSQRKVNKLNSKSNGNIHNHTFSRDQDDDPLIQYKTDPKLPAFTSRLKAPSSRISMMRGSEEI